MDIRQHLSRPDDPPGEATITYDIASGHVDAYCAGFWSTDQAAAFFADWTMIVRQIHNSGKTVSSPVELSEGQVQSGDVAGIIARETLGLYAPGDRVAMLVPTSLAKMQMRRILDASSHQFFISRSAAETWLGR